MGTRNFSNVANSALGQTLSEVDDTNQEVDRAIPGNKETSYQQGDWSKYNGYYRQYPEIKAQIDKLGLWTVGKGYNTDEKTEKILSKIKGFGKDSFNSIMENLVKIKKINGDSYAHIIKDKAGRLINLKPLNPGSIKHVTNSQGMLTGYKQVQTDGKDKPLKLGQIFHLVMNRTADEVHGTGDIESLTTFLDKIKQLDEDMSVMFHRFIMPLLIWKLNTDNPAAITKFKLQEKEAWNKGDNMVAPEKAVDWDLIEAGKNGVNPMDWRNKWTEEVIKGGGVPALIMAIESGSTEASSKMVTLAWEKVVKKEQMELEKQVKAQLHLKINLPQSITIEESLAADEGKDANRFQTTPQKAGKDQK